MSSLVRRLVDNKFKPPHDPPVSFAGQTIIVTGANIGLGYEAALKYVQKGAGRVILGVRNPAKGAAAKRSIEAAAHRTGVVDVWPLDMNSYASVKAFVERAAALERLDVAVLNAGVFSTAYARSPYGWETDLQVNTLSTVLLALLLLPTLRASHAARGDGVVPVLEIVASGRYVAVELSPDEEAAPNLLERFNAPDVFKASRQYAASKLFVMYAVREIARLAGPPDDPDVVVTSVCPGACKSELARGYLQSWWLALIVWFVMSLVLRTTEQGARALVSGTAQGKKVHGGFWKDDKVNETRGLMSTDEKSERLQAQVWHEVVDALRKDVPEVLDLVKS